MSIKNKYGVRPIPQLKCPECSGYNYWIHEWGHFGCTLIDGEGKLIGGLPKYHCWFVGICDNCGLFKDYGDNYPEKH